MTLFVILYLRIGDYVDLGFIVCKDQEIYDELAFMLC